MAAPVLVCFAVRQEAAPFLRVTPELRDVRVVVTGMGRQNAERSIRSVLAQGTAPACVITSGFAGGLDPSLETGTVVFDADEGFAAVAALVAAGGRQARFHCAPEVAVTAEAKRELRAATGADAVEMESEVIRAACRERGVPGATVRVISDAADENLPLDFNALMTPDLEMDCGKLAWALAKSPGKVPELIRFQRRVKSAAAALARVLCRAIAP